MTARADSLPELFIASRHLSLQFCNTLVTEDYGLQAAAFASPPKWHLAHTSWFFETFLLLPFLNHYKAFSHGYDVLFNSYYQGVGEQFPRDRRGLLSRPTVAEVCSYREHIDHAMLELLSDTQHPQRQCIMERTELGINHEQQHQELFFTDVKYSLGVNPQRPAFAVAASEPEPGSDPGSASQWSSYNGGLIEIGFRGNGFCFDNELPRHKVWLEPYTMANRLVSNADYQKFMDDGGYQRPELWLADGWSTLQEQNWKCPLYWIDDDSGPSEYTLYGLRKRNPRQPVCHISGYEAEAYARWAGARLPTEAEWENAAAALPEAHNSTGESSLHPRATGGQGLLQLYDACWQWTRSAYLPYPGFSIADGAIGEYNGKFMSSQWILRGGSCVSRPDHLRASYRNFFYPQDRWQFSGIRLAK